MLIKPVKRLGAVRQLSSACSEAPSTACAPPGRRRLDTFAQLATIKGSRILLVEDNELNQEVATELLRDAGFIVDLAENGRDRAGDGQGRRLRHRADGHADAGDGRRDGDPGDPQGCRGFKDLPVVAMTANAMQSDRDRCLAAGMNDHVSQADRARDVVEGAAEMDHAAAVGSRHSEASAAGAGRGRSAVRYRGA